MNPIIGRPAVNNPGMNAKCICLLALLLALVSCSNDELLPVRFELGTRSISKLPFVIALDQGLYEKYGLDVDVRMPRPDFEGGIGPQSGLFARIARRLDRTFGSDDWPPISISTA